MSDDTLGINLTLDQKETAALSRALTLYADYHQILAAEVAHEVLTPNHEAWANYFTDLATSVRGGQTRYGREDLIRISEALDQYSDELPSDLQSVDTTVRDQLYKTGPQHTTATPPSSTATAEGIPTLLRQQSLLQVNPGNTQTEPKCIIVGRHLAAPGQSGTNTASTNSLEERSP